MAHLIRKEKDKMKTYNDLTNKEKRECLKEFKKTPGGADCYLINIFIQFICMHLCFLYYHLPIFLN